MKRNLLDTGSKILAEASRFEQVWGIGLRADDPDAHDPRLWRGNNVLGQALSTVRDLLRHNTDGSAHPSSFPQLCTPTLSEGIYEMNPAPLLHLRVSSRACPRPPSEISIHFSDAPGDHSPDVLAVAPCAVPALADTLSPAEHGPSLVEGTATFDDASFITKIALHSGTTSTTAFGGVALLDTGSPQTFINRHVLERMILAGADTARCEQDSAPRLWAGFGQSALLRTSTSVRLNVQLFLAHQLTSPLTVWACVVPPSDMQHAVFLGRDSWMRFKTRSYRSPPPRPSDGRMVLGADAITPCPHGCIGFRVRPRRLWRWFSPPLRCRR